LEHIEVINVIIETERRALEIVEAAAARRAALPEIVEAETRRLREAYYAEAERGIEAVRAREERRVAEECEISKQKLKRSLDELDALYDKKRAEWTDAFYNRAVKF